MKKLPALILAAVMALPIVLIALNGDVTDVFITQATTRLPNDAACGRPWSSMT